MALRLEIKLLSLFTRVRRLQQAIFGRAGDYIEESTSLLQLGIGDYVSSLLTSPFMVFEEPLTLVFELFIRFTANVIFESMSSSAIMRVLIDAYQETFIQLAGELQIFFSYDEAVTLTETFLPLKLWMNRTSEVVLSMLIEVKVAETLLDNVGSLVLEILQLEAITVTETDLLKLWMAAADTVATTLGVQVKLLESFTDLERLLEIIVVESEPISISDAFDTLFLNLDKTSEVFAGLVLIVKLTESFTDMLGTMAIIFPIAEAVDVSESFNYIDLFLPITSDVVAVATTVSGLTATVVETLDSLESTLSLQPVILEAITTAMTFNAFKVSLTNTSAIVEGISPLVAMGVAISSDGLMSVSPYFLLAFDMSDTIVTHFYGVASTTIEMVISSISSVLSTVTDSLTLMTGYASVSWPFDESMDMGVSETTGMLGAVTSSISEAITAVYIPLLFDTFESLREAILQISDTDTMSVADALDYVDLRGDGDTDLSVNYECVKSCPSCYNCDGCEYCNTCDGCDAGPCNVCDDCQGGCDTCDECEGCDESCQTSCQTCDNCINCITCINCQSCVVCQGCHQNCDTCYTVCDTCDSCDGCQVCNTCDHCDNCDTCDGSCYTCNQPCYFCDSCDTCNVCASCDICQTCYSSCEQCDDYCQTCATCYASCYACDECNNNCELCYQE